MMQRLHQRVHQAHAPLLLLDVGWHALGVSRRLEPFYGLGLPHVELVCLLLKPLALGKGKLARNAGHASDDGNICRYALLAQDDVGAQILDQCSLRSVLRRDKHV